MVAFIDNDVVELGLFKVVKILDNALHCGEQDIDIGLLFSSRVISCFRLWPDFMKPLFSLFRQFERVDEEKRFPAYPFGISGRCNRLSDSSCMV